MRSRTTSGYRIADEPTGGALSHLVVQPIWPLLAGMLGGLWLGLPWLVFNAYAMGSATKTKETVIAVLMFLAIVVSSVAIAGLVGDTIPDRAFGFLLLGVQLMKLGVYYALQGLQSRSFELHQYYGGTVKNGMILVIAGAFLRSTVLGISKSLVFVLVFA